jgi:hypothetical protein
MLTDSFYKRALDFKYGFGRRKEKREKGKRKRGKKER